MKLFKNRMVLGIACIVVSLIICFAITPLINAGLSKKATVVRMRQDVKAGEQLDASMLEEVQVGSFNLPAGIYRSVRDVEGMYLTCARGITCFLLKFLQMQVWRTPIYTA